MVTSSKIYEVSTGRMVNNGTDKGLSCPAMPLAKSERQKVKTVTAGEDSLKGYPAHRPGPHVPGGSTNSGDPLRSGLTSPGSDAGSGQREPGDFHKRRCPLTGAAR